MANIESTKALSYGITGTLPNVESATKALSYGVTGPGIVGRLNATTAVSYGVLAPRTNTTQRINVRLVQRTGAIT